jgi:hypothetical protein
MTLLAVIEASGIVKVTVFPATVNEKLPLLLFANEKFGSMAEIDGSSKLRTSVAALKVMVWPSVSEDQLNVAM